MLSNFQVPIRLAYRDYCSHIFLNGWCSKIISRRFFLLIHTSEQRLPAHQSYPSLELKTSSDMNEN